MTWIRSHRQSLLPILLATSCAVLAITWPQWRTELRAEGGYGYGGDHLTCYRVKDPLKVKGFPEIDTAQFGLHSDCKLSRSQIFCVPSSKLSVTATSGEPLVTLPVSSPPALTDLVCYKMRCKRPIPPDAEITDQFGNRVVRLSQSRLLCVPALKGSEYCGDGMVNGDEECDGNDDAACSGGCRSDCMCGCERACCYIDSFAGLSCLEYTGRPAQVEDFFDACAGTGGESGGLVIGSPTLGRCTASPFTSLPCELGVTPNANALPTDSLCAAP